MSKIAAIHQPNFLPWLGYFYKIANSDIFIILDDAQYTKNSFINRNKIKTPQGTQYITLPVSHTGKFGQLILECSIDDKEKNAKKITRTIELNYRKAKYFSDYFDEFQKILNSNTSNLAEINVLLIEWILEALNIQSEIRRSSELKNVTGKSTERLVSICQSVGADEYLSGFGGVKYQEEAVFKESAIKLKMTDFHHPQYPQCWGDFIPNLSIIDLLFNCGPESKRILWVDNK